MKLDQVDAFARSLPAVTTGSRWNNRTWMVGDRGFAWERPFSKADLKRYGEVTPPQGDIVAIMVENLDAKDALLAMELPGVFTIPHFANYPAILVELRRARVAQIRPLLRAAHALAVTPRATRTKPAKPAKRTKPTKPKKPSR